MQQLWAGAFDSLRIATGDPETNFLQPDFVFAQLRQPGSAAHQHVGDDAVINVVIGERDFELMIELGHLGHFGMSLEQLNGLILVRRHAHPNHASRRHLVAHTLHRTGIDQLSLFDDGHAITDALQFAKDVRTDDDRFAEAL